jgi:hypothetical protein
VGAELFHARGRTDGRTDRDRQTEEWTGTMKLTVAFRNFANTRKKSRVSEHFPHFQTTFCNVKHINTWHLVHTILCTVRKVNDDPIITLLACNGNITDYKLKSYEAVACLIGAKITEQVYRTRWDNRRGKERHRQEKHINVSHGYMCSVNC